MLPLGANRASAQARLLADCARPAAVASPASPCRAARPDAASHAEDLPRALRRARAAPRRPDRRGSRRSARRRAQHPGHGRARTLLNTTFRKAKLVQRAAILEAADWLIAVIDRATMLL